MNALRDELAGKLSSFPEREQTRVLAAFDYTLEVHVGLTRASGEPYITHPLAIVDILLDLGLDADSLAAALLHDVLGTTSASGVPLAVTAGELEERFGQDVRRLVESITKIADLQAKNKSIQEAESIRKMLFAMVEDIRVILIKLADKLHNMRTLQYLEDDIRKATAQECLDIYAPLADRLGISWVKDELEDLALKQLNRDVYDQIKQIVALKKAERDEVLERTRAAILQEAAASGFTVEVKVRAKHFWSIYQKMRKRNKGIEDLYDLLGIRILCDRDEDCYTLLGAVHRIWKPMEGRFKDYIAMPKANGYRSLHTTVMGFEGKVMEIQIRTHAMHQLAENGVASHWLYKKGTNRDAVRVEDLSIVNRLKDWKALELGSNPDAVGGDRAVRFLDSIKRELLKDSIFVFTPQGKVIELPAGATAIDFAYQIHSAIGDSCMGAKADGAIIPLSAELKNTQVVEILTSPQAHPHINWLKLARTSKARSKIRAWLLQHDETLIIDRNIVARKSSGQAPAAAAQGSPHQQGKATGDSGTTPAAARRHQTASRPLLVSVENERNMVIHFARCCKPITGDAIIGYVSRGRGIIVHRTNCRNLIHIGDFEERKIDVQWETDGDRPVYRLQVVCDGSSDIFSELEGAVRKYGGHLLEGRVEGDGDNSVIGNFTIELEKKEDLKKVLKNVRGTPSVRRVIMFD